MREKRLHYQTNRAIKGYCLWLWLKSVTKSGIIQGYGKQVPDLIRDFKISRATFYNYLNYAEDLQLITRINNNLQLASWQSVADKLGLSGEVEIINYDTENKYQKYEHIIDALEIDDNQKGQEKAISTKIAKHTEIATAFKLYNIHHRLPEVKFNVENLKKVQKHIFEHGAAKSIYGTLLSLVNPEVFRNAKSLAKARNYKSPELVPYLKRKLKRAGLITVLKSQQPVCKFRKDKVEGITRGKQDKAFTWYDPKARERTWYKPDKIIVSPFLLQTTEKPRYSYAI